MPTDQTRPEPEVEEAFDRLIDEGRQRLERPTLALTATGLLGGVDVSVGILAYLVVREHTGDTLLAALAFSVGFVALLLARSELFTENFLVPVVGVVGRAGSPRGLLRLWGVTFVMNLVAGVAMMAMLAGARPDLGPVMREAGLHYYELGFGHESFLLAVLAGLTITLMTRMQHATENLGVQLVPAVLFGAVLVGAEMFHCVLDALLMAAAMISGADMDLWRVVGLVLWAAFGNMVGGVGLVTGLRLLRVSRRVQEARAENRPGR
ncbi:formate/nitrite transporter family protein [Nocardioides acrostichi]|uniref:Formate/nitrite transporter family protein n=1 Tax=Nocardioides acrostichi TaxID=2784339 RepID=A0A930Y7W2_9ACTN|nr:formate/nitrite transporter family protein [Nocardioides acrostichi]MBF4162411.1 formate/nitrite transporter family protein [Nocardioides acrostichi]